MQALVDVEVWRDGKVGRYPPKVPDDELKHSILLTMCLCYCTKTKHLIHVV